MATNTNVPLKYTSLDATASSVTLDLTGITGYTDLEIVINPIMTSNANVYMRVNGDAGSHYSQTYYYGNGSNAYATRDVNANQWYITASNGTLTMSKIRLFNYANTNVYKTALVSDNLSTYVTRTHNNWRGSTGSSYDAITSVTFLLSTSTFAVGSTFAVYGIAAEGTTPAPKATGGAIYSDSLYYYHVFGSTGVFTPSTSLTADVLCVAGGGAGGHKRGGGGGAGGLSYQASRSLSATGYTVTVGAGGSSNTGDNTIAGGNGGNSAFDTITSNGGGGGASAQQTGADGSANNGGSGGGRNATGQAGTSYGTSTQGNTGGATGYGNRGGDNGANSGNTGGGGGGAGAVGGNGSGGDTVGGVGGAGLNTWATWATATGTGVNGYYAGGGGGGTSIGSFTGGTGGVGGGGNGTNSDNTAGTGVVNTGGGGGGGAGTNNYPGNSGGNGGSGVVIVRYLKA